MSSRPYRLEVQLPAGWLPIGAFATLDRAKAQVPDIQPEHWRIVRRTDGGTYETVWETP